MLRTREVNAVNVNEGQGDAVARGEVFMVEGGGERESEGGNGGEGSEIGPAEHLARQLARVRSKFGMDPAATRRSFKDAWLSPTVLEEDEAEFIDAVADCLGAGLPLEAALTCWDTGELALAADEEEDEPTDMTAQYVPHVSAGRRLLIR
jgi:hypothetical protein